MAIKIKLPELDLVKLLEEKGVLQKFTDGVMSLLDRGHVPTDDQSRAIFSDAMQSAPGVIREALDKLPVELAELLVKGKSKVTKDTSSLA